LFGFDVLLLAKLAQCFIVENNYSTVTSTLCNHFVNMIWFPFTVRLQESNEDAYINDKIHFI